MELTVLTQELKNKEFATQLNKLKTKINSVKRSNWEMVKIIAYIMEKELYKDDLETDEKFAEFIGTSRPNLNKMKRLDRFMTENDLSKEDWTVTKAMELLTLTGEEITMLLVNGKITPEDTVADIREVVRETKQLRLTEEEENKISESENEEENEGENEEETDITKETDETHHEYCSANAWETGDSECVTLTNGKTSYKLTLAELAEITRKYKFTEIVSK